MNDELRESCRRAIHVVTPEGELLRAGRASLHVLEEAGFRRLARIGRRVPLLWAVEIGYRIVARNRRIFSRLTRPFLPEGEDRGGPGRVPHDEDRHEADQVEHVEGTVGARGLREPEDHEEPSEAGDGGERIGGPGEEE